MTKGLALSVSLSSNCKSDSALNLNLIAHYTSPIPFCFTPFCVDASGIEGNNLLTIFTSPSHMTFLVVHEILVACQSFVTFEYYLVTMNAHVLLQVECLQSTNCANHHDFDSQK